MGTFDHDFIIIGSGFGGSPSALRLVEKGYDVLLLEAPERHRGTWGVEPPRRERQCAKLVGDLFERLASLPVPD